MKKSLLPIAVCLITILTAAACTTNTSSTSSSSSSSSSTPISSITSGNSSLSTLPSTPSSSSSSSSSSTTPSTSTIISVDPKPDSTAEEVYNFIKEAGEKTNYTLEIAYDDAVISVIYNQQYIYYSSSDAGYITIENYKSSEDTLLYNFTGKNSPVIENAVSYVDAAQKRVPITKTQTLNALYDSVQTLSKDDIQLNWDYYYSKNSTLIESLAYLIGASSYTSSIAAVKLALSEDHTYLDFRFVPNFNADVDVIDSLNGRISNLNNSNVPQLDTFLSSYTLPEVSLSDNILSSLSGKQSFTSTVNFNYNGKVTIDQKDEVVIDATGKQTIRKESGVENSKFIYLTTDDNGEAFRKYVNASNTVVTEDLGVSFNSLVHQPVDLIEKEAFRKTSENTYTYFGYDGRGFISKLIDYEPGEILSIDLTVKNNKISNLHAISTMRYDSYQQPMYYDIYVDFGGTKDFKEVKEYSGKDKYESPLGLSLNPYVDRKYGRFVNSFTIEVETITGSDVSNYMTHIYVTKRNTSNWYMDTIIIDRESVDTSEGSMGDPIHKITGFYETDKGLAPFKVIDENKVIASGPVLEGKKLSDALGMDISYLLFSTTDKEELTTEGDMARYKLFADVDDIADHIIGGDNVDSIIPSSLTMTVTNTMVDASTKTLNKVLTSIEYEFNGDNLYKGKERLTFTDYGTTSLPSELDFSTFDDWKEPTTWKEGAYEVYQSLTTEFSENEIAMMPYLYEAEIEGNWGVDVYNDGTYIWCLLFNDTFAASDSDPVYHDYAEKYVALLKANGFVEKEYPLASYGQGVQLYKDGLYVRIPNSSADTLMSGIRFLIEIEK